MPVNAVRYPNWWMRGGYEDVFSLNFGDWSFPLGTASVSSLWVYTWGKVRTKLRGGYEIASIGAPMSAVPQFSEFWHSDGTNGSKILTWHNFFLGRVPIAQDYSNSVFSVVPISAQLELFPNGDYIARSNLVERAYKRINPDDWDDDGIPNDIDDEPLVSNGENFGPSADLPDGANADNYCWVEVTVSGANSLVTFQGDKPSNLPDPRFVARAGEVYRVNLLIGKTYRVSSAQPIECTAKSNDAISVDKTSASTMHGVYPVSYEIVDAMRSVSRQVRMIPPLIGSIQWDTNSCPCHAQANAAGFNLPMCYGACSCYSCDPGGFTFNYEGYSLSFGGVECDCAQREDNEEDEPRPASVEVSFSKRVIIFEDTYETAPNVVVPLRSTSTTLSVNAHGGHKGGMVYVSLTDGNRLVKSGISLPYTRYLNSGESISFDIECTGHGESASEDDIVVNATFTENETGEILATEDRMTVVRVDFMPELQAEKNHCIKRHKVGVREVINCSQSPERPIVQWSAESVMRMRTVPKVQCPLFAAENPIVARCKGVEYRPLISVVEPNGIEARKVDYWKGNVPTNCAGGIGLTMKLHVKPLDVSFERIAVEEVPCNKGTHTGYFALPYFSGDWYHSRENGAGNWHKVQFGNLFGDDTACISNKLDRVTPEGILIEDETYGWMYGSLIWEVPFGWNEKDTSGFADEVARFAEYTRQEMIIFDDGRTGVSKFANMVIRHIDGKIFLNRDQKE